MVREAPLCQIYDAEAACFRQAALAEATAYLRNGIELICGEHLIASNDMLAGVVLTTAAQALLDNEPFYFATNLAIGPLPAHATMTFTIDGNVTNVSIANIATNARWAQTVVDAPSDNVLAAFAPPTNGDRDLRHMPGANGLRLQTKSATILLPSEVMGSPTLSPEARDAELATRCKTNFGCTVMDNCFSFSAMRIFGATLPAMRVSAASAPELPNRPPTALLNINGQLGWFHLGAIACGDPFLYGCFKPGMHPLPNYHVPAPFFSLLDHTRYDSADYSKAFFSGSALIGRLFKTFLASAWMELLVNLREEVHKMRAEGTIPLSRYSVQHLAKKVCTTLHAEAHNADGADSLSHEMLLGYELLKTTLKAMDWTVGNMQTNCAMGAELLQNIVPESKVRKRSQKTILERWAPGAVALDSLPKSPKRSPSKSPGKGRKRKLQDPSPGGSAKAKGKRPMPPPPPVPMWVNDPPPPLLDDLQPLSAAGDSVLPDWIWDNYDQTE